MKFGQGKSESTSCALARPYKQLFEEGKTIGRINHVFFKVNKWPSRVLGSLCFTPGQQLLFYPGLTERKVNWCLSKKAGFKSIRSTGFIDHLTLDKKFRRWHVTILEPDGIKKRRLPSSRTKQVHKNTIFWFGLTIQDHSRLEILPKTSDRVFKNARAMYSNYYPQRNRAAEKFSNPRLKKITFITLRHWKGTMEYHKTKDILHVKKILGHKNIQNTMIYINLEAALFTSKNDEFTVRVADNLEEACKLLETGFEYVTDYQGKKLFRKRK